MRPREADVEALLTHGAALEGEFRWRPSGEGRYRAEAWLTEAYEGARIRITGTYNHRTRNISYSLVWGAHRVRGLDVGGPAHPNPDGEMLLSPHKHRWTDRHGSRYAYVPDDINSDRLEGIFHDFLAESNVRFLGQYYAPEVQDTFL
jgi:hypothetical protein